MITMVGRSGFPTISGVPPDCERFTQPSSGMFGLCDNALEFPSRMAPLLTINLTGLLQLAIYTVSTIIWQI